jgi:hypothetical protein
MATSTSKPRFTGQAFSINSTTNDTINTIKFQVTDVVENYEPPATIQDTVDGNKRWYERVPLGDRTSKHWRKIIGNELAHKYLLLDPTGEWRIFTLSPDSLLILYFRYFQTMSNLYYPIFLQVIIYMHTKLVLLLDVMIFERTAIYL